MSHLAKQFFFSSKDRPNSPFKIPAILNGAQWTTADDIPWLLRTVKIKQCVAFVCSNQAKYRNDTSTSVHVFQKDNRLHGAWIQAVGKNVFTKKSPFVFGVFRCWLLRIHGETSEWAAWIVPLEAGAIPTIFPHKPARSARTSSSRRAEKRQRQEVCKHSYAISASLWYICFEMSLQLSL